MDETEIETRKIKENEKKRETKRIKTTSHPRIAHGQRYPMPCLE